MAVIITAFIFAPLATQTNGAGSWHLSDAFHYVLRNALLYQPPFAIGGTLRAAPYPDAWNGSLWTLFYEFSAYLVVGAILTFPIMRRYAIAIFTSLLLITTIGGPTLHEHLTTSLYQRALFLGSFFIAGCFMWTARNYLPLTTPVGLCALTLLLITAILQPANATWVALPLAYVLLWLGNALPIRLFSSNDVSYGMYIYAFPIQQLFTVITGNRNAYLLMIPAFFLTLFAATISWRLIEKPALSLKRMVQ